MTKTRTPRIMITIVKLHDPRVDLSYRVANKASKVILKRLDVIGSLEKSNL